MTAADAILIVTGVVTVAIIVAKVLGSLDDLRVLFSWRGVASYLLMIAAVFLMVAFYVGKHSGPIFPGSPFRYFAWIIALALILAGTWIDLPPSTRAWLRRNRTGVFTLIRAAQREYDRNP